MTHARARDLVSSKVGLIRTLVPQPRGPLEPVPPYLSVATLSHYDFRAAPVNERVAAGKGRTAADADAAAIGEAMERYCACQWDESRTFRAPWSGVGGEALSPLDLILYAPQQYADPEFPFRPWNPEVDTTWIDGTELPAERSVSLPASLVYLVSPAPRPEDRLAMPTSNGLAAGPTLHHAILGGLCEVMERDAMLTCWMNRLPASELDLDTTGPPAVDVRDAYARQGVTVRAFVLPTDLPATAVMGIAFDDDPELPAQVVGVGCHPIPDVAVEKALFELCQARPSEAKRFRDKPPDGRLTGYRDVRTLEDHSAFAARRATRGEFAFLWSTGTTSSLAALPGPTSDEPGELVRWCSTRLADAGHRVAYSDLTLPDVASVGLHVVRVVVSGLQPIHFGDGLARLGGTRLFELPRRLGVEDRVRRAIDLNPCPHPLA